MRVCSDDRPGCDSFHMEEDVYALEARGETQDVDSVDNFGSPRW